MKRKANSAFTLVELIVVITILAILGTIAFISLQGYSKIARDSRRTSDISNIKTSLELFILNTGYYPQPDVIGSGPVYYSGDLLWTQGTVGNNVATNLSRNLQNKPLDPLFDIEYTYSLASSNKEYQLMVLYEGELSKTNNLLNNSYASNSDYKIKVEGTYNEIFLKTPSYIVPVPSIITSEDLPLDLETDATKIQSMIITGGPNFPKTSIIGTTTQTGGLTGLIISVTGTINTKSTDAQKISVTNAIQNAYSGSTILASKGIYKNILDKTTDEEKIAFTDTVILNKLATVVTTISSTDWRDLDPNCTKQDIPIYSGATLVQIWAGCNTTLDIGIEYSDETYCYNYDKDGDGTNSNLGTGGACGSGNYGDSNDNAKNYYDSLTGTINQNNDIEVDNIWGKLYTWYNVGEADGVNLDNDGDGTINATEDDEVCPGGYHIPSDDDWSTLEQSLGCSSAEASRTGWGCDGQGWKLHSTTNNTISIAEKLQLPLAGNRDTDGVTFGIRGSNAGLWSSTPYSSNAYIRYLYWDNSKVHRNDYDQVYGLSVRCVKD